MLTLVDMSEIARARITDAVVLIREGRYDTAIYLCGYAVEISLKARVCRTLGWTEFPNEPNEWKRHHTHLKVHDLRLLAKWSGCEVELDGPVYGRRWQEVHVWNPETRYQLSGGGTLSKAISMVRSARTLASMLNPR